MSLLLLPVVAALLATPAIPVPPVEGEQLVVTSGVTKVVTDPTASAGAALKMLTNGAANASVSFGANRQLSLRLRGDSYLGAPHARVRIDGAFAGEVVVAATTWTDYLIDRTVPAGTHSVTVEFVNDAYRAGVGDRNLRVDLLGTVALPPVELDDPYEADVVALVNVQRAKVGLAPLAVSACADSYAEQWSAHLAATGQLVHQPDLAAVLAACSASRVGENIAYGNVTAAELMAMWMGSAGHRANILNPAYTHIGVAATMDGTGRVWATQEFLTLARTPVRQV